MNEFEIVDAAVASGIVAVVDEVVDGIAAWAVVAVGADGSRGVFGRCFAAAVVVEPFSDQEVDFRTVFRL